MSNFKLSFILPLVALFASQTLSSPLLVVSDAPGDDAPIQENEIIKITTVVNGVQRSEIPELLAGLDRVRRLVKQQAFDAFKNEVAVAGTTREQLQAMVTAVESVLNESLEMLSILEHKLSSVYAASGFGLTEEEAVFLQNVRQAVPQFPVYTAQEFQAVIAQLRQPQPPAL